MQITRTDALSSQPDGPSLRASSSDANPRNHSRSTSRPRNSLLDPPTLLPRCRYPAWCTYSPSRHPGMLAEITRVHCGVRNYILISSVKHGFCYKSLHRARTACDTNYRQLKPLQAFRKRESWGVCVYGDFEYSFVVPLNLRTLWTWKKKIIYFFSVNNHDKGEMCIVLEYKSDNTENA